MRLLFTSLTIIFLAAVMAFGQSQSTTGNIEGRVIDQTGAVVPGVAVSATNQDTGFGKTVMSDDEGNYIFVLLPPGNYKVEVAAAKGFAAATYNNVSVTVGAKTPLEITMNVGTSANVVDVTSDGQTVETTRSSISTTVDERAIDNLPVNGRNFLDFATLTPGVIRDPNRTGDLSVGGQKGTLNSLQIDGVSNDNTFFGQTLGRTGTGRAPFQFSIETVKEFQINQNGFSAEFGRAGGAVINVVTKSGTNRFHGSAFEFFRDEALNANTPILKANQSRAGRLNKRPKSQTNQFGATFGGPFRKDKAFFFFAYDGQRSTLPNTIDLPSLATAPANVRAFLGPKAVDYNFDRKQDVILFKTDFVLNDKNQLSFRFNQQFFTGKNNENSGPLSAEEHSGNSKVTTTTLTSSWTSTLSSNWFNEFRFQFSRDKEPGEANSTAAELTVSTPNGTFNIGRNNFSPRETTIKRYQFVNNQTLLRGDHTIKYGVDLLFDRIFNFFPGLFSGSFGFNGGYTQLSNYLAGAAGVFPTSYRQNFAGAGTSGGTTFPNSNEYGFFVQDDWRANRKLTVNFGLRYDYQSITQPPIKNPSAALATAGFDTSFRPNDKNNIAPRFGISYAIDEKTVVRGGYGIFYARTPSILTGTAHSQNGVQVIGISLTCSAVVICPTYPNAFTTLPTGGLVPINLYLFDKNYKQPFVHQARVSFEREVMSNLSLSLAYTFYKGDSLTHTRDANFVAPVDRIFVDPTGQGYVFRRFNIAGTNLRPVAGFNRISLFESSGRSQYHGFSIEARRRFANKFSFIGAYTVSEAKDDKPDQTIVVAGVDDPKIFQNNFDPTLEYGRSDLDLEHRFVFSPVYEVGKVGGDNAAASAIFSNWVMSGIIQIQSGFAYSAAVTGNPNNDDNTANDRVPGTRRNQFSTPNTYQFDLRLTRVFPLGERYRLTFLGEGFNIFNRSNISGQNNQFFSSTFNNGTQIGALTRVNANGALAFGQPNRFLTERQVQLGIKFEF
ncbi:MAG: TonB-dependent receptor [Pyrinomonadaceae bacterium]